jgi:hypothetical protein
MGVTLIGFILGALAGAATGTELGVVLGAVIGILVGFSVYALGWMRSHLGSAPVVERHRTMCAAYGNPAEVEFVGDLQSGCWQDVRRCSLLSSSARVDCDKGCLRLITIAGVRPGGACSCQSGASPRIALRD